MGIERAVELRLGTVVEQDVIASIPDEAHEAQLTRENATASVDYIGFALSPEQVARFVEGPAALVVDHPAYQHETPLTDETRAALAEDLRG